jgi:hypothetical protein
MDYRSQEGGKAMSVMDSIEEAYQVRIAALEAKLTEKCEDCSYLKAFPVAQEEITRLEAEVEEKDEIIEKWKREHNRLIEADCVKITALNGDNEILRNMNKILLDSGAALAAERDGYRNGQAQVQSIADGLMDTIEKYAKERTVLTAEEESLKASLCKWIGIATDLTAENERLKSDHACRDCPMLNGVVSENNKICKRLDEIRIDNQRLLHAFALVNAKEVRLREALEKIVERAGRVFVTETDTIVLHAVWMIAQAAIKTEYKGLPSTELREGRPPAFTTACDCINCKREPAEPDS